MIVNLKVRDTRFPIGYSENLKSFFCTVNVLLEKSEWGKRFPVIMNGLYKKEIPYHDLAEAKLEFHSIFSELENFTPEDLVWDVDNITKSPPEDYYFNNAQNLVEYFVTSDNRKLIDIFNQVIGEAIVLKSNVVLTYESNNTL